MKNIAFIAFIFLITLHTCLCELKPTHLDMASVIGLTTDEVIKILADEQS